jgi:hypothetical protein
VRLVGFEPKPSLSQRLAKALDADFNNALVHADVGFFGGGAIAGELKYVGLQTGILTDDVRDYIEGYHALAQQKLQAKQGFCADGGRFEDLNRNHDALTNPYIGQSERELYFGLETSETLDVQRDGPCGDSRPRLSGGATLH